MGELVEARINQPFETGDLSVHGIALAAHALTFERKAASHCSPAQYGAGIKRQIAESLISLHDSGAYFSRTDKGTNVSRD